MCFAMHTTSCGTQHVTIGTRLPIRLPQLQMHYFTTVRIVSGAAVPALRLVTLFKRHIRRLLEGTEQALHAETRI